MKAFIILLFVVMTVSASAQTLPCDSVYTLAGKMPTYGKGGPKEFFDYLNKNLEMPKKCKASDLKRILFTVDKAGKVSDIEVIGVKDKKCQAEVIRQLQAFPDWNPGMDQGQPVCVRVTLPIVLKHMP